VSESLIKSKTRPSVESGLCLEGVCRWWHLSLGGLPTGLSAKQHVIWRR